MDGLKYSEILKQNTSLAKQVEGIAPYRITILSNITCNQLRDVLSFNLRKSKLNPEIEIGNYDNIIQDSFNCNDSQLVVIHYDLVNIVDKYADFIEDFSDEQIESLLSSVQLEIDLILRNLRSVPAIVFNSFISDGIHVDALNPSNVMLIAKRLNEYLYAKKELNLLVLDITKVLMRVGLADTFDFRMYYLSKTLYTISFWKEYAYELSTVVYRFTGKLKKAIIFDCDNTLWKGIIGEDGENGIDMSAQSKIGQIYNKVQQIAVWLSKQGVIIGLCSKNNQADVESILKGHPDVKLTEENIVISKINWQDKATNLRKIAEELNIGLDSLVFVDDSSFEIDLVKTQIPEIITFQVPIAIHEYPQQFLNLIERYFYLSGNVTDVCKTKQYKAQFQREEEKRKYDSLDVYLASLELELEIKKDDFSQVTRIAQLTQKTNQFNLTTQRYTEKQVEQFMEDDKKSVYSVSVKDKFGESGLTAVVIVCENSFVAVIDSFLMSCRIMGRNIEFAIINYIVAQYSARGFKMVEAVYFPTAKNEHVCDFYNKTGCELVNQEEGNKYYNLVISDYKPSCVEYIKIKK